MMTAIPTLNTPSTRVESEHTFTTSDGVELFYRCWAPQDESSQAVVLFHRGHEHSGRWQEFLDRIAMDDVWFFAWDARGHGRSPGERGYAESFGRLVRDADEFVRHISQTHGIAVEEMSVVGQSVGAVLAATWVHDYAPPIKSMVLATPALRINLYVPLAIPGLRLLRKFKPKSFIKSYVKPTMLTHDPQQVQEYQDDELISPQISTKLLLDLHDTSTRLIEDAGAIHTPTLLLMSGKDWVVKPKPQLQFFERLSSKIKEREIYPSFFHSTFWEKDRDLPIARTREFLCRQFEKSGLTRVIAGCCKQDGALRVGLRRTDRQPQSRLSPKRWSCYALQKIGMYTAGRLSRGVRISWQDRFDSGESLDHVYRNTAEGFGPIGKSIDQAYLNSPSWESANARSICCRCWTGQST